MAEPVAAVCTSGEVAGLWQHPTQSEQLFRSSFSSPLPLNPINEEGSSVYSSGGDGGGRGGGGIVSIETRSRSSSSSSLSLTGGTPCARRSPSIPFRNNRTTSSGSASSSTLTSSGGIDIKSVKKFFKMPTRSPSSGSSSSSNPGDDASHGGGGWKSKIMSKRKSASPSNTTTTSTSGDGKAIVIEFENDECMPISGLPISFTSSDMGRQVTDTTILSLEEYEDNSIDVEGQIIYPNGDVYVGDWDNELQHGKGNYVFASGDVYDGDWVQGQATGRCTLTYARGDVYEGEIVNFKFHGQGMLISEDGSSYTGAWKEGCRHGKGTFRHPNGTLYEGAWVKNRPHGKGRYRSEDGSRYNGEWRKGQPNGEGFMLFSDGKKYQGQWVDGRLEGFGAMWDPYAAKFTGDFHEGKPTDAGTYYSASGSMYSGIYEDGIFKLSYGLSTEEEQHAAAVADASNELPSLEEVLALPTLRQSFVTYCERWLQTESLYFLLRVDALRRWTGTMDDLVIALDEVLEDFVVHGSPHEININGDLRAEAIKTIQERSAGVEALGKPYDDVFKMLISNAWGRFAMSEEAEPLRYISRVTPPGAEHFHPKEQNFSLLTSF